MKLTEIHYHQDLRNISEYDYCDVVEDEGGRIKIKFQEERWRTIEETVKMLDEMKRVISEHHFIH
jgi:hypothetical protein